MTVTHRRMAEQAHAAVLDYLADGEWHGHHEVVAAVRRRVSEAALRETLRKLRSGSGPVQVKSEQPSYRHGKQWWYRLPPRRKPAPTS